MQTIDILLAKKNREPNDTATANDIIALLEMAGDIGDERRQKYKKLIEKKERKKFT